MKQIYFIAALSVAMFSCSGTPEPVAIIPQPLEINEQAGSYNMPANPAIAVSDSTLIPAGELLALKIGGQVTVNTSGDVVINMSETPYDQGAYELNVTGDGVEITTSNYNGAANAVATIMQLMPVDKANRTLQNVTINDAPRFDYRGLMLDVSRHFYNVDEIKKVLDYLHMYKLNKFHWHITDDQGWRIEIKKYPLLTEKGAWREFNKHDRECMKRAKEENRPEYEISADKLRVNGTDTLYGGFYTQEDIKEIVAYATERGIDVMPEIDMPGHFLAAVANYPYVACQGISGWGKQFSSPVCVGSDKALEFCKDIYAEVFELFPYAYVHLGADEVEKTNWKQCADCKKRMRTEKLKTPEQLQAWFVKDMEKFFNANGRKLVGWDEILEGGLSETATIMWWRSWAKTAVHEATAQGNEVIMTPNFVSYFDYQQDVNTLKSLYNYDPTSNDFTPEQADYTPEERELIRGIQGNVWCEYIPSFDRLEYMIMPRILALSEIGWSSLDNKNWESFKSRMPAQLRRFDQMAVNYRVPDLVGYYKINVFIDTAVLDVKAIAPATIIHYTTDGTVPTINSPLYTEPIVITETTDVQFATFRPDGSRSDVSTTKFTKQTPAPSVKVDKELKSGLNAAWYDYRGGKCAEVTSAKLNAEFVIPTVSRPDEAVGNVGLDITGYIEIPEDGIYTFSLTSDDGSMLYIAGQEVISNDNAHSPREVIGQITLSKGLHPLRVLYFDHNGGMLQLQLVEIGDKYSDVPVSWYKH